MPPSVGNGSPPPASDALSVTLLNLPALPPGSMGTLSFQLTPPAVSEIRIKTRITTDPVPFWRSALNLPGKVLLTPDIPPPSPSDPPSSYPQMWPRNDPNPPPGYVLFWVWPHGPCGDISCNSRLAHREIDRGGQYIELNKRDPAKQEPDLQVKRLSVGDPGYVGAFRPSDKYNDEHGDRVKRRADDFWRVFGDGRAEYQDDICKSDITPDGRLKSNCIGLFHLLNPDFRKRGLFTQEEIFDELAKGLKGDDGQPLRWDYIYRKSPQEERS